MAKERANKESLYNLRETQCKKWARNPEIIKCLKSIINWAETTDIPDTSLDENVHDWVNNIIWYSNMQDIDPVFTRIRSRVKGREKNARQNG